MAVNPRKRQKQLARKAAQASARAKAMRASQTRPAAAASGYPLSVRTWPVHEAYISDAVQTMRQGTVILSRKSGESVAVAVFLVDAGCMGVKSAFGRLVREAAYGNLMAGFRMRENLMRTRPECVRKLVEGAVDYAADLGFSPDPDYHSIKVLFGNIDSDNCDQEFEFGHEGKPYYVSGPADTPTRIRAVMNQLSRKCGGPDGFHFMIASPSGIPDDFMDPEE